MSDIIVLKEGEKLIADHKLPGLRVVVTNLRLLLVRGKQRVEIPVSRIQSFRVYVDKVMLGFLLAGLALVALAFIVPSINICYYENGTTCIEYGFLSKCPSGYGAWTGIPTLPIFLIIGTVLAYYGYKHLERLEVVMKNGNILIIKAKGVRALTASLYTATEH